MRQFRGKYSVEADLMNANYNKCGKRGSMYRGSVVIYEGKKFFRESCSSRPMNIRAYEFYSILIIEETIRKFDSNRIQIEQIPFSKKFSTYKKYLQK